MDLSVWIKKQVKIDIYKKYDDSNFYFKGVVLSVDEDFLTLQDFRARLVTLSIKDIKSIREVSQWYKKDIWFLMI